MTTSSVGSAALVRGLGLAAAASVVVGNVIGTGVFLKARVMTCNLGSPGLVLGAWVAAGLLSVAGALAYAELAAMMPHAGGDYVYLREAYGSRWAVLYGWMQTAIGFTGSMAAKAAAFAIFLNVMLGGALERTYFTAHVAGWSFPFGSLQVVALATIVAVTLVNCMAVTVTGGLSVVLSGLKVAIVAAIGIGTFVFASGDWGNFAMTASGGACEGVSEVARGGVTGFGAAMLGALWAYDGWSNVTMLAGEVKDPKRNLPRALIGGIGLVLVLYLVINTAYFYVLTPNEVQSVSAVSSVAAETVRRYLGSLAVSLIAASMLVSTLGSFHSTLLAGSRIPYAVAQDGHFPRMMGRLSPRSRVPIGSILVMSAWSCLLTLSGSFDALTDYSMFGSWLFYGLATGAIFVFRKRMPDAERPYRAWGYPVLPALFLVVTAWLLVNTIWTAPTQSLVGLVIVALGLPIHWYYSRRNTRMTLPTDASGRARMVGDD